MFSTKRRTEQRAQPRHAPRNSPPAPRRVKPKVQRSITQRDIDPSLIDADPSQPRKTFEREKLLQLADSITKHGIFEPPRVTPGKVRGRFTLVAGERRWRAALEAKLDSVPCIVIPGPLSPDALATERLIDEFHHEPLSDMEKARALERLKESLQVNQSELAQHLGISPSQVSKSLALVLLPPDVQEQVGSGQGQLNATAAAQIARLPTPEQQTRAAREMTSRRLPAKAARAIVDQEEGRPHRGLEGRVTRMDFRVGGDGGRVVVIEKRKVPMSGVRDTLLGALDQCLRHSRTPAPVEQPPVDLQVTIELLTTLGSEAKTLEPSLQEVIELFGKILGEKLRPLLSDKNPGLRDAATRVANKLSTNTCKALGLERKK